MADPFGDQDQDSSGKGKRPARADADPEAPAPVAGPGAGKATSSRGRAARGSWATRKVSRRRAEDSDGSGSEVAAVVAPTGHSSRLPRRQWRAQRASASASAATGIIIATAITTAGLAPSSTDMTAGCTVVGIKIVGSAL